MNRTEIALAIWDRFRMTRIIPQEDVEAMVDFVAASLLKPIPGPPDIEAGELCIVEWDGQLKLARMEKHQPSGDKVLCFTSSGLYPQDWEDVIQWHIPLGVITPPAEPMPKCPFCGGTNWETNEIKTNRSDLLWNAHHQCDEYRRIHCWGATEAEALAAAREVGE